MAAKPAIGVFWKAIAAGGGVGLGSWFYVHKKVYSKEEAPSSLNSYSDLGSLTSSSVPGSLTSSGPVENDTVPRSDWNWDFNWDKRDPHFRLLERYYRPGKSIKPKSVTERDLEELQRLRPRAKRNIILIRHGQYDLKPCNDSGRKLTSLGKEQAQITGKRLKEVIPNFDRYVVSDMTRALETAEIIGKELRHKTPNETTLTSFDIDPVLREGAPIQPDPANRWHPLLHYFNDEVRIEAAFRKYFHRADPEQEQDSYELIVCHANVIRYFCCRALQFPPERWLRISLANGSITHIRIDPDGDVILYKLGDAGHMPKHLITTT